MVSHESPSVTNLMDASSGQLSSFGKRVAERNGKAQVVVHPYYRRSANGVFQPSYISPDEYAQRRDKFMSSVLEKRVPTVILEQFHEAEDLGANLPQVGGEVLLVETQFNSSDPSRPHTWESVAARLKEQGVQHAVVSGLLLNLGYPTPKNFENEVQFPGDVGIKMKDAVDVMKGYASVIAKQRGVKVEDLAVYRWLKEGVIPMGCTGTAAIGLLQNGIDVSLSPISAPEWVTGADAKRLFTPNWYSPLKRQELVA